MQQRSTGMAAAILLAYAAPLTAAGVVQEMELSGMAEVPANASTAVGVASVTHDALAHTLRLEVDFSGMLGATVGAHIHCCADANTNAPTTTPTPAFPLGVTEGSYDITLDLTQSSSFYPSFITGNGGSVAAAEAALARAFAHGAAYLNVHTTVFPAGEIRGQVPRIDPLFSDGFDDAIPARTR